MGEESDPPGNPTIWGLSNKKNDLIQQVIERDGVQAYEGSVRYVNAAREAGLRTAIVSSSANTEAVLKAAGVDGLFEVRVDHQVAEAAKLRGKPAPDTFLEAARLLGVAAANATVYEDALAGVAAGRAGKFGFVIGVDRVGQATELHAHGADVVVKDLADLL
jgi:HAD superfamily hydrolase (TIGR01509 family)